ncbi:MFS transporter, UMF1 family [Saccharopolyspora antimicrobica]|uniref:MFS transporter, UMF1 family n=1 Tax=Saccharopolyspora antimicrobica TaxID=455193 RepID=A0A1I5GMH9_9PSEU|nr:MFS transporter [Saccharopolyspora antimicrobica]RKT87459.1 UMF1 family MFS transporter [Saccharopolyspora antimicrobica]SFO37218.1 MFS transporter, UMF1 family [Saccharopolyspora antimicrobica]
MSVMGSDVAPDAAQRRREQRGWCWYDWANSVFPTSVSTVFLSLYLTAVATSAAKADTERNGLNPCPGGNALVDCDISVFGLSFPAGSLWGYLLSVATVVQVLVLPITGAIADRSSNKRLMLAVLAFGGAATTALLALVGGQNWQLGVVLFILANICFGASVVVYYSFLPEIANADERDMVSTKGWAFGYLGAGVALALHLVIYLFHDSFGMDSDAAVRVIFLSSGVWWAAFTLLPLAALPRRRTPEGEQAAAPRPTTTVMEGFKQLKSTLREAKHFPLTLAFLGAYWIFTDGIATVVQVAPQYGNLELKLPQDALIVTVLIVQFIAFIGGMLHGLLAKYIGAKKTILISLSIWLVVVVTAYFVQAGQEMQFYGLAVGIGLVLGGTNALSRSLFSQMVPPGREAEYFSLYEIGERSTSWLGPLVFAGVGQATGSFRLAIISLVLFFAVGLLLVALVPVRRAIEAVGNPAPKVL